jgi:Protein of unknown function (DUF2637)
MHMLVALHGQPGWVAALTPLSVDGMILAASATLLADSRSGRRGGMLPWALLVAGSVASLAANVAVAEPALIGRAIAAWPSFALTASFELLTRQVRCGAANKGSTRSTAATAARAAGDSGEHACAWVAGCRPIPDRPGRPARRRRPATAGVALGAGPPERGWGPAQRRSDCPCPRPAGAVGSACEERGPGWCLRCRARTANATRR